MKFSNGCWLQKEGCQGFSPARAYFSKIEGDAVTICAPTSRINHRGDTLGGVNLTIKITAPYPEVLRIQTWHHMGLKERTPPPVRACAFSGGAAPWGGNRGKADCLLRQSSGGN